MPGYKEATCKVLCSRLDTAGYFYTLHISPVTWISPIHCAKGRPGITAARGGSWGSHLTQRRGEEHCRPRQLRHRSEMTEVLAYPMWGWGGQLIIYRSAELPRLQP